MQDIAETFLTHVNWHNQMRQNTHFVNLSMYKYTLDFKDVFASHSLRCLVWPKNDW